MNEAQTSNEHEVVDQIEVPEEQVMDITTEQLFQPQRLENETREAYKERLLVAKYKSKQITGGRLIWDSKKQGTYQKSNQVAEVA